MKDYLISIALLLILVACFSTIESAMQWQYPFGNWAVPGNTGQPLPGEGEPGAANAFSFGSAEQAAAQAESQEAADFCPITVTVATEQEEKTRTGAWGYVLVGGIAAHLAACMAFTVDGYLRWFKERKKEK